MTTTPNFPAIRVSLNLMFDEMTDIITHDLFQIGGTRHWISLIFETNFVRIGLHWKLRKVSVDKKSVFSLSVIMGNVLPGEWFDRKPEFIKKKEKKKKENWKITVRQFEPSPAVSVPDVNETKWLVSHGHLLDAAGNISTICWTSSFACR